MDVLVSPFYFLVSIIEGILLVLLVDKGVLLFILAIDAAIERRRRNNQPTWIQRRSSAGSPLCSTQQKGEET